MLEWLKRKATPVPGEQPVENEIQKPAPDERLERLLGRLGSHEAHTDPAEIAPAQAADRAVAVGAEPPTADPAAAAAAETLDEAEPPKPDEAVARATGTPSKAELPLPERPTEAVFVEAGKAIAEPVTEAPAEPDKAADEEQKPAARASVAPKNGSVSPAETEKPARKRAVREAASEIKPLARPDKKRGKAPAATAAKQPAPPPGTGKPLAETTGGFSNMRIIAVCSQKGGSGKTTIAAHLAVRAGEVGQGPAVLIDTDPQGSLSEWWHARSEDTPALAKIKIDDLQTNLAELRRYGTNIVIIDTPPALTGSIEQVIAVADLILIPARPSPHDLRAVAATVEMARAAGKPFLFVVNGAAPRASITAEAVAALSEHGRVVPVILYQRTEYAASMIDGRTVLEAAHGGRSAQEIAELWQYVHAHIGMRAAA